MDANRSGGACVHLRGRSSAVKLGRHVITYRKAVGPILHIRIPRRKADGDCTVCWWYVLRRLWHFAHQFVFAVYFVDTCHLKQAYGQTDTQKG